MIRDTFRRAAMPISLLKESDPLGWMDAVFVLFFGNSIISG